jgi:hypothetical protein
LEKYDVLASKIWPKGLIISIINLWTIYYM